MLRVFEIAPEPEFSRWFESLPERVAEEVAGALEVAAGAGAALDPDRVSRALLWYDGTAGVPWFASLELLPHWLAWQAEALRCLESPAFATRLLEVEPGLAKRALDAVARVKASLRSTRLVTQLGARDDARRVREHFHEALRLVGLEPHQVRDSESGLCELTLGTSPKRRVLFGVDSAAQKLVVILGEELTRKYYGDSVRFAERRWSEHLARTRAAAAEP
jgi:hypothetical protein